MKFLTLLLTTLFLFSSPVVWGEEVNYDDLIKQGGLFYKKFTDEPFTGVVVGEESGRIIKGKREGKWTGYFSSGHLEKRLNYTNDKLDGLYEEYYKKSGEVEKRVNYKNGKKDGLSEEFLKNGQLSRRGYYKNGKRVGKWEFFNKDGTPITCRQHNSTMNMGRVNCGELD